MDLELPRELDDPRIVGSDPPRFGERALRARTIARAQRGIAERHAGERIVRQGVHEHGQVLLRLVRQVEREAGLSEQPQGVQVARIEREARLELRLGLGGAL